MKKYPIIKQPDIKDCGATCLAMIIKYYGGNQSLEKLKEMTKTDKNGASAYDLVLAAKELGFEAYGVKCGEDDIKEERIILPAIAHLILENKYQHYVVVYKINYSKKTLLIADPSSGLKTLTFNEFTKLWDNIFIFLYPVRNIPFEKNQSISTFIYKFLTNNKGLVFNIIFLSFLVMLLMIALSFYTELLLKSLGLENAKEHLLWLFIIFLTLSLFKTISDFYRNHLLIYINQKVELLLMLDSYKNIITLPYSYYHNHTTGEMMSRINDLGIVKTVFSKVILLLIVDLFLAVSSFIILYIINKELLMVVFIILTCYIITVLLFKKILLKNITVAYDKKAHMTSYLNESLSAFELSKGLSLEGLLFQNFSAKYLAYLKQIFKLDKIYNYQFLLKDLINNIGFITIMALGTLYTLDGKMTFGQLLSFNTLFMYFQTPLRELIDLDVEAKEARNAFKRILDFSYFKNEESYLFDSKRGDILISNLNYQYKNQNQIINQFTHTFKEGSRTIVSGKSGTGKSTLLKILMKYYPVPRNTIYVSGVDLNDIKKLNITFISQQEVLFTDTILNNIKLKREVDDQLLFEVLKMCRVDEIVAKHNLGYNFLIEENGFNLSGGERQRLVLARSLLKDSPYILIDEGLSEVDLVLERTILIDVLNYFKSKTIIFVSHRMDNADLFDQHLIMRGEYVS